MTLTPEEQKEIARRVAGESATSLLKRYPFRDRGFSDRTIDALVARGIDAPERLLFVTETELRKIPGIGKASLGEIMRYRARYIPER
jgi:DNA-directed RNA polymerase alpha subunit